MARALKPAKMTRRGTLGGLLAVLSCPAVAALRSEPDFDVLIVGAGAAGIAAGRRLLGSKRTFAILEATDRMGGRCFTDTSTFGVAYDRGACAAHLPAQSSLAKIAAQRRVMLHQDPEIQEVRVRMRSSFDKGLEEIHSKLELEEFYSNKVRCFDAISRAAAAGGDMSCAAALPDDLGGWRRTMEFVLGPYRFGAELKDLSAKEYAVSIDWGPAWFCPHGTGALIGKLALGVPIKFFSPVTLVDWGDRAVVVETSGGTLTARAAIVTASTAVLASGKVKFRPGLPPRYAGALDKLKLGNYDHVAIQFKGDPLGLAVNEVVFEKSHSSKTAAMRANVNGSGLALLVVPGQTGAELSSKGPDAMTDFALDWIAGVFGADAKQAVTRLHATSWSKEPWTLGAFSSATAGAQEARKILAEPLNDTVWFAGEALDPTFWGSVGGAWQDGERAADAVLARLDKR